MVYIKYSGSLQNRTEIRKLEEELIDISQISGWSYELISENFQTMTRSMKNDFYEDDFDEFDVIEDEEESQKLSSSEVYLDGIVINIAEDSDPLAFTFDKHGKLANISFHTMNTQGLTKKLTVKKYEFLYYPNIKMYTNSVASHKKIIKLLEYVKKRYIKDLEVIDTSFYWDNKDEEELKVRMWKAMQNREQII